jgi:hypothetical protein
MNERFVHGVPECFSTANVSIEVVRGWFWKIFARSAAAATITTGLVVEAATAAPEFSSVPMRQTTARTLRRFRPPPMRDDGLADR